MHETKIDKVVLQLAASKGAPTKPSNIQTSMFIQKFPDKFIGFAGFNPHQGEQAIADIEHAIKDLGYKGLKTVSPMLELDINDKIYYRCYAKAQELSIPIMIHTGASTLVMGYRVKHAQPLMIDDVAFDFPDLKIICAHMGGHSFMDVQNLLVRHRNVYAALSFWPLHPLYKNLIPWRVLEETVSDKILLGSDYPCGQTPKEAVEAVRSLPINEAFKLKILGENAARLLSL
jgi:predicted TIM-barrel fold metal-dependent hydrolase